MIKQFEIGQSLLDLLNKAEERLISYLENKTAIRRNKLLTIIEEILIECQTKSNYSAVCCKVLH